jgi:hypothetical protein
VNSRSKQGEFEVIDSFVIRKRGEFFLIGEMKEGTIREQWFVNVPLNLQISLTLRITRIEEIELTSEPGKKYMLLVVAGDNDTLDLFMGLRIESEPVIITIDGED